MFKKLFSQIFVFCMFFMLSGCVTSEQFSEQLRKLSEVKLVEKQNAEKAEKVDRINQTYEKNQYGTIIQCQIENGNAKFKSGWYAYTPETFTIVKGEGKIINVHKHNQDIQSNFAVEYAENGQKMTFCGFTGDNKYVSTPKPQENYERCESLYMLDTDFSHGIKRTLDVPKTLRSSQIECKFKP